MHVHYPSVITTNTAMTMFEDHDNLSPEINLVKFSHRRGSQGHFAQHLTAAAQAMSASGAVGHSQPVQRSKDGTKLTIPCIFTQQQDDTGEAAATSGTTSDSSGSNNNDVIIVCPPASIDPESYNIVKFYNFDGSTVNSLLLERQQRISSEVQQCGASDLEVEIAFKATAKEHQLIYMHLHPPQSILLLGRSGTGKTTV
jgi:hypothetical protein